VRSACRGSRWCRCGPATGAGGGAPGPRCWLWDGLEEVLVALDPELPRAALGAITVAGIGDRAYMRFRARRCGHQRGGLSMPTGGAHAGMMLAYICGCRS